MEKWQTEIKLKFPRWPWKITVRFSFEWKAWLLAWELFDCSPDEFGSLGRDLQFTAVCYGAAVWDLMKRGKSVFFTHEDLIRALLKASKEDNLKLADALEYAKFPQWLQVKEGEDKKKASA